MIWGTALNKPQTDARGLLLPGCCEAKDLVKQCLAHSLTQCCAASFDS